MKHQNQLLIPNQLNKTTKGVFSVLVIAILMLSMSWKAKAQTTYTWTGTTNTAWATPTNWSPNGNPGAAAGDIVNIPKVTNQPTVTVAPANALASLTFTGANAATFTLTINGVTLNVTGAVTLNTSGGATRAATIAGTGTLTCGSLNVGNYTGSNSLLDGTTTLTSSIASLNVSNQISIISNYKTTTAKSNATFTQSGGTVTAAGITTTNTHATNTSSYITTGTSPTLNLSGASSITATGTSTFTLNATGTTVNYAGAAQTVLNAIYNNLGLSGSGTKTLSNITISSNLSVSGTAVASLTGNTTAGTLTLGGINRISGTWGSTASSANNQNDTYFSSGGQVTVATYSNEFITRWNLATAGSGATQLSIGTATSGTVNYTWQQVSGGSASGSGNFSGNTLTITGLPAGATIRLKISPSNFQRIHINNLTDKSRLLDVEQWGSTVWTSMEKAFYGCNNLNVSATDIPVLTSCNNMSFTFAECTSLNSLTNINSWNTGAVTNMGYMFNQCAAFNQNIGSWNTGAVTNMGYMFNQCATFNQNIGSWNTAAVTNMGYMFKQCAAFNQNIGSWNTGAVTNMGYMFNQCAAFNQNIGSWNTGAVTNMGYMFKGASAFNNGGSSSINNWNTGVVTDMSEMFSQAASFNQNIGSWNTWAVNNMGYMFYQAQAFNQNIGSWNTGAVTNMFYMFNEASAFNNGGSITIDNWNTAAVTNMGYMFYKALAFNQNIGSWNTGAVTNMFYMFTQASAYNNGGSSTINNWNTGAVTNMTAMFYAAESFNQNIGSWSTGAVTSMGNMFIGASAFNNGGSSTINNWNTAAVTSMDGMFGGASAFNQNIGNWRLNANVTLTNMLNNCGMNSANYSATLVGWNANVNCPTSRTLGSTGMTYDATAISARANLVLATGSGGKGWTITGDALVTANNWTGATSNTWNVASNWSLGIVPSGNNEISISSGTPILNIDLSIQSGKSLVLTGTGTLIIEAGKSLSIASGGTVNFDGKLVTLKSVATGTASIGTIAGTLSNATNVTVERFIPRRRAFRFLSSPVNTSNFISNNWQQATHISGSTNGQNGFDQSPTGTASLYTYNTGTEAWAAIPNTNATNLTIGAGYRMLIRGNRTINLNTTAPQDSAALVLSATGSIVTGNVVFGAGSVSSSPTGISALNPAIGTGANGSTVGWTLIGNPYASAVNWANVTKSNVSATFATWNVNNAGRGSYVYHNGSSGSGVGNSNIINSGQAIFVQTTAANPSITFTEASKVTSTPPSHFKKSIADVLNIDVFMSDRAYDGLAVMFDENYNNQYDAQDFIKLVNPEINFYSYLADGTKLAMNNMKEIGTETIVPLGLNGVFNGGMYELKFSNQNSFAQAEVKLKDKFINKIYDLKSINNLTFTVTADSNSWGENRFELIFSKSATGLNNELSSNNNFMIFPNPANDVLNLSLTTTQEDNYSFSIFNHLGAAISNGQLDFNSKRTHALNIENLSNGVYFIQVKNGKSAQTIKFIK